MIARLAGLFTICALTTGAAIGPVVEITPARELHAASRLARDGDLQADWNKLLDTRARLERLVQHPDVAALVHYQLGYLEWRLSLVVSEWLEAVWAAIRSVLEHGSAWSRELLFSWRNQMPRSGHCKPSHEHGRRPITMIAKSTKFAKEG